MQSRKWTEELFTGNEFIDRDHRQLVDEINALIEAANKGTDEEKTSYRLNSLIVYARKHFDREEAEMLRIGYSDRTRHQSEHTALLNGLLSLKDARDSGTEMSTSALSKFLSEWLDDHISHTKPLANALNSYFN